mgnify:CR=1 FL=1
MKQILILGGLILTISFEALAQETMEKAKPTDDDKTAAIPADKYLSCGAPFGKSEKVSLNKVLKDPAKYTGKTFSSRALWCVRARWRAVGRRLP